MSQMNTKLGSSLSVLGPTRSNLSTNAKSPYNQQIPEPQAPINPALQRRKKTPTEMQHRTSTKFNPQPVTTQQQSQGPESPSKRLSLGIKPVQQAQPVTPKTPKTPIRLSSRGESAVKPHSTLFKPAEGPPQFAIKTIKQLEEIAQKPKKRPQSAMKVKNISARAVLQKKDINSSMDYQQHQPNKAALMNASGFAYHPSPLKQRGVLHQEGARPHVTKMGVLTLPPINISPNKQQSGVQSPAPLAKQAALGQLSSLHLPAPVPHTDEYIQGNKHRVEWIQKFLEDVTKNSRRAGELTLEEKIERLQIRLGGRPLPIEQQLGGLDTKQAMEKVEKMKHDLESARQGQEGEAPRVNLQDPELLRQYQEEQDKIARAKRAAEEKIRKEKEEALAKQKAEEDRKRREEERKKQEEERHKQDEERRAREAKENEARNKVMKEAQERIAKMIHRSENDEEDPFAMLKKKPKKIKVEEEDTGAAAEKKEEDLGSARKSKKLKKKKTTGIGGLKMTGSSKQLELADDGTVPQALVKESNEAVDLLKQADDKLQRVLDLYLPSRKSSSNKSKASSKRSKASHHHQSQRSGASKATAHNSNHEQQTHQHQQQHIPQIKISTPQEQELKVAAAGEMSQRSNNAHLNINSNSGRNSKQSLQGSPRGSPVAAANSPHGGSQKEPSVAGSHKGGEEEQQDFADYANDEEEEQ